MKDQKQQTDNGDRNQEIRPQFQRGLPPPCESSLAYAASGSMCRRSSRLATKPVTYDADRQFAEAADSEYIAGAT
jgi:hypothetical protein